MAKGNTLNGGTGKWPSNFNEGKVHNVKDHGFSEYYGPKKFMYSYPTTDTSNPNKSNVGANASAWQSQKTGPYTLLQNA
jgi:hypothetical protein